MPKDISNSWLLRTTISATLSWLMKLILTGLFFYASYKGDYLLAAAAIIAIVLSLLPSLLGRNYNATLPWELDFLITLAFFLHTFFGEWLRFYDKLWFFDKFMHLYGTSIIAIMAFMIVYTFHATKKLRLTLPFTGLFTITFAMAVGGLWEIGEFTFDKLLDRNTQYSLDNTMWDMINNVIGGTVVAVLGMLYIRPEERKRITKTIGEVFNIRNHKKRRLHRQ
ncbi:MAG: hypothetical protein Q7T53_13635 [Deltaproteobacteria bacterium]|nr:hypothetical protein [Deltaproteobacteria bacterium]